MRFTLPDSYAEFFSKNQIIELEEILTDQEADLLCSKLEIALSKALHEKPLTITSNSDMWKAGRTLWEEDPEIKNVLLHLKLGEIAHFLFKKRPIKLGYAQTFFTELKGDSPFPAKATLTEISSFTPVLGGAFLCLNAQEVLEIQEPSLLPDLKVQKKGRAIFFSGEYPLPLEELFKQKGLRYLLLCFIPQTARYKLEPKDLHTHLLKKQGYVFGDTLKEETCPYVYY